MILVTFCLTGKIKIKREFKQGHSSVSFLFLMVSEGLSVFFGREVDLGIFSGFKVKFADIFISHL